MSDQITNADMDRLMAIEICLDELKTIDADYGGILTSEQRAALDVLMVTDAFVGFGEPRDNNHARISARRSRMARIREALDRALPSDEARPADAAS